MIGGQPVGFDKKYSYSANTLFCALGGPPCGSWPKYIPWHVDVP